MPTESKNFTMLINGENVSCELSQWCSGNTITTTLKVGKRLLEESTGGGDCYLNVSEMSEKSLIDYAIDAIFRDWQELQEKVEELEEELAA